MTAAPPSLSIVVPVFNSGHALEHLVASVVRQTSADWELVLVDDGSSDAKTLEVLGRLEGSDGRIRVLHQQNKGVDAARDNGVAVSRGRYVCFCDHDDALHPQMAEYCVGEADRLGLECLWYRWRAVGEAGMADMSDDSGDSGEIQVFTPGMRSSDPELFAKGLARIHVDPWAYMTTRKLALEMPFSSVPYMTRVFSIAMKVAKWAVTERKLYLYSTETPASMMKRKVRPEWTDLLLSQLAGIVELFAVGEFRESDDPVNRMVRRKHVASCLRTVFHLIKRTGRAHGPSASRPCWLVFALHVRRLMKLGAVRVRDVGFKKYVEYLFISVWYREEPRERHFAGQGNAS